ncbi:IS701 family transposase [Streptomyces sp. 1222.5]|uniref:IS701 family transposase n=1 Tax=Streptomyces sp. 1222.5 TaxID=1881026 RepID=UPI003EB8B601
MADVFGSLPRRDQRRWGECYLRGLMLDGRRKSIQPMAERLPDGNMQVLQQFVNQSPWDWLPVRRRIAERLCEAVGPEVWVVDDVSFPKCGTASAGVAWQYCGALGKRANCQVAVSVHAATDTASCPLEWELFLPGEWTHDDGRRRRAGIPEEVGHASKTHLALGLLDRLAGQGLAVPVIVADAGYGRSVSFRLALEQRGCPTSWPSTRKRSHGLPMPSRISPLMADWDRRPCPDTARRPGRCQALSKRPPCSRRSPGGRAAGAR